MLDQQERVFQLNFHQTYWSLLELSSATHSL